MQRNDQTVCAREGFWIETMRSVTIRNKEAKHRTGMPGAQRSLNVDQGLRTGTIPVSSSGVGRKDLTQCFENIRR